MKYTVSSLSKLLNVSSMTIRRYTQMGYITPEKNQTNNYTYYNSTDVNTIVRVRMYRKFGFTHEEIKKMFLCDLPEMIESFEHRLKCMNEEFEKLNYLKNMFKANMVMIKRIDEFEKGFITQDVEATYYIAYQDEDKLLKEPKRLKSIQEFMYNLPETKEVYIFKKENIDNNNFKYAVGFAAKKKDTDRFNIEINEYMTFQPVQKCIYFLLKTYFDDDKFADENNKLKKESFENAKEYLKKEKLKLNSNVLGFNITTLVEDGTAMTYTLICLPVEDIN